MMIMLSTIIIVVVGGEKKKKSGLYMGVRPGAGGDFSHIPNSDPHPFFFFFSDPHGKYLPKTRTPSFFYTISRYFTGINISTQIKPEILLTLHLDPD